MSTAEILDELPRLTPAELAEIRAKLDELAGDDWGDDADDGTRAADAVRRDVAGYAAHPVAGDEFATAPSDLNRADNAAW